jgi:methyl-accepting chemotaxis protein
MIEALEDAITRWDRSCTWRVAEEQTAVVETLNVDINQINLLNQQGVANLNETLKDCDALSQQASRLKQLVDSFKI